MNKRLKLKTIAIILAASIKAARFYNDKFKIDLDEVRTLSGRKLGFIATKSLVNRLRNLVPDVSVDVNKKHLFITVFDGNSASSVTQFENYFSENPVDKSKIESGEVEISADHYNRPEWDNVGYKPNAGSRIS